MIHTAQYMIAGIIPIDVTVEYLAHDHADTPCGACAENDMWPRIVEIKKDGIVQDMQLMYDADPELFSKIQGFFLMLKRNGVVHE